jgi:hypothetical protein
MTAKICADIKPTGIRQRDLVDLMYQMAASLEGLCDKLDADDAAVTTYASGCIDAVMNCTIEDSQGNRYYNYLAETSDILPHRIVSGLGVGPKDLIDWMYEWTYTFYLMCVKLDASAGVNDVDYTSLCYTPYLLERIVNGKDDSIGVGTDYTFSPTGVYNEKQLIDWLYHALFALDTLAAKLDDDVTLTDTDYESLWYTNTILLTVENSSGDRIGN